MSRDDDEEEVIPTASGQASTITTGADEEERIPGFMVPDPESRSGWRYYYVKRQRPGTPSKRGMGFR